MLIESEVHELWCINFSQKAPFIFVTAENKQKCTVDIISREYICNTHEWTGNA